MDVYDVCVESKHIKLKCQESDNSLKYIFTFYKFELLIPMAVTHADRNCY